MGGGGSPREKGTHAETKKEKGKATYVNLSRISPYIQPCATSTHDTKRDDFPVALSPNLRSYMTHGTRTRDTGKEHAKHDYMIGIGT